MFSPGNQAERIRMGNVTQDGERVVDMFAGIGYFSLPISKANAEVTEIERNTVAYQYLVENAVLNSVSDNIRAIRADCKDVIENGIAGDIELSTNRIVMGYYDAYQYLEPAIKIIDPGGVIHFHEAVPNDLGWDRPLSRIESAAQNQGCSFTITDKRKIKTHGPGVSHVVIDLEIN
jgi:tRNA wybutosine-synthesizing protein 2